MSINIIQRILDAASVNGKTFADIQADSQGKVNAHAISVIHSLIPASGDLIVGGSGVWLKLPIGANNAVLRTINGAVSWDTGNGILSFVPALGDLIIGGSGQWNKLGIGADKQIVRVINGSPAWDTESSLNDSIVGQWAGLKISVVSPAHADSLLYPVQDTFTITFNVNGTCSITSFYRDSDEVCFQTGTHSGTWTQDSTGVFKIAFGGSPLFQVIVAGNIAMFMRMNFTDASDAGIAEMAIMGRGIDITALAAQYTANLCTQTKPSGVVKGAMVTKGSSYPIAPSSATIIPWDTSIYDMTPPFMDLAVNNTKFVIPYGITQVKIKAQGTWIDDTAGQRILTIHKNGSAFAGQPIMTSEASATNPGPKSLIESPILRVVEGDYFQVLAQHGSTTNPLGFGADGNQCWFAIEVIA
jgi:hypothetical protein